MKQIIDVRVRYLQKGDRLLATGNVVTDVRQNPYNKREYFVNLEGRTYRSTWNASTSIRVERGEV